MSYAAHIVKSSDATMAHMLEHSFLDYHIKGFSYLCLRRSESETIKIYFFDGDVSKMPEVVAPHDHRYDFSTLCLAGAVENRLYSRSQHNLTGKPTRFQKFDYLTPLNGGAGFTWRGEVDLYCIQGRDYRPGRGYGMMFDQIHTIQLRESGTILCLRQYADQIPLDMPTSTYTLNREPPSLSGLYRKPTEDDVIRLLRLLGLENWYEIFKPTTDQGATRTSSEASTSTSEPSPLPCFEMKEGAQ